MNYFDTAVQYGDGESENNLGRVLADAEAGAMRRRHQSPDPARQLGRIAERSTKSLEGSLERLRLDRVDIFHLHNPITDNGGGAALSVGRC